MKTAVINGKKYIVKKIIHKKGDDTFELIPYDSEQYTKIVNEIVTAVKGTVDPEEAVKQALASLEWDEIEAIHKALYKKKQKPRSHKGCYEITVGRHSIPMVN